MNLEELRNVVTTNMPYDTGYMYLAGAQFTDTPHFMKAKYDTERVPYIIYQEEGYTHWLTGKFIDVNKGFIKDKTVGALLRFNQYKDNGIRNNLTDKAKRKASTNMVKEGALTKIRQEGKLYGYR